MDEIFLELLHTERLFLLELDTINTIARDILIPLGIVETGYLDTVGGLKNLHGEFVNQLSAGDRAGITPNVLNCIVKWVCHVYTFNTAVNCRNAISIIHYGLSVGS